MCDLGDGPATLHIRYANDSDLARLYPWLDTQAATWRLPAALMNGMHVALEEAVMNVVMHGFDQDMAGDITVRLLVSADSVALLIEDSGRAFNPTTAASPARPMNLLDAEPGGLGLTLLRHYCKDITYERVEERNRLTLSFPLSAA